MSGPQFFETRMGQAFYDGTMPRLVKALERIADRLDPAGPQPDADMARILAVLPDVFTFLRLLASGKSSDAITARTLLERAGQTPEVPR